MEPVTHFLFGATMGRAGLNRKTALATATLTLAAEAPDLDVISRFGGSAFGLNHHRGFTHSLLGIPLVAAAVVGLIYLIWRLRGGKIRRAHPGETSLPPRWGLLFAFACLAGLSHLLLDFTNNYGVRPFWPFSERWYSWDIVFIVEPVILVALVLGLTVPVLLSLVRNSLIQNALIHKKNASNDPETRPAPGSRLAATLALLCVVACWGFRDFEHRRALAALEAHRYQGVPALRVSAYPFMTNPFHWYGVVETRSFFATRDFFTTSDALAPLRNSLARVDVHPKPEETAVTLAAKNTYLGRVYLSWAQYPVTETKSLNHDAANGPAENSEAAYAVQFRDLRYDYPVRKVRVSLGAVVLLSRGLKVVEERFGAGGAKATPDSGVGGVQAK